LKKEKPAMQKIRDVSEDEMIAIFLQTEITSIRFGEKLKSCMNDEEIEPCVIQEPNLHDETENFARRKLLGVYRGYGQNRDHFTGFPAHVRWEMGQLSRQELERVRYIDWEYWLDLTDGTRMAIDGARNALAGKVVYDVSSDWLVLLADALRRGARFPPLILVAQDEASPLVVMEGHGRLTAYLIVAECIPDTLNVIILYAYNMNEWDGY
jgi:hypothetical protein